MAGRKSITLILILFTFSLELFAQDFNFEKHIRVSMRKIGHELLLASGDSTSRVLSVDKDGSRYKIQFEAELSYTPDTLQLIIDEAIKTGLLAEHYLVEVEECLTEQVIYAYEIGNTTETNILTCSKRGQPMGCYTVFVSLLESDGSYRNIGEAAANKDDEIVISATKEVNLTTFFLLTIPIVALIFGFRSIKKKKAKAKATPNPKLVVIGKYEFNKHTMELSIDQSKSELTSKEADLLFLLFESVNTTIERDTILQKVWGDQGDYIGRTLDVFISKLRKKLEADPNIKIINIRGVGYKMLIDD